MASGGFFMNKRSHVVFVFQAQIRAGVRGGSTDTSKRDYAATVVFYIAKE